MKNAKFLQRAGAFALALTMALSLAGCGQAASGSSQAASSAPVSSAAASSEAASSQAQGPIQLTDQAGRQVELEEPAQSLVSCYYIPTDATLALGVSDRVVGLEKKAETRPVYQMADPALLEKPQLGTLKEFDVEAAAALEPDLVLMPVKLMDYVDALTELGIPVLVVDPENQDRLEEMLTLIGQACGVEDRAQSLIDYYHEQENRMAQLTEGQERPLVYMGGNSSYLETATNAMYQGSLIQLAGGQNAAGELEGDYWTEISYESLHGPRSDHSALCCLLYGGGYSERRPAGRGARCGRGPGLPDARPGRGVGFPGAFRHPGGALAHQHPASRELQPGGIRGGCPGFLSGVLWF